MLKSCFFTYDDKKIEYTIIRRKRKTVGITVSSKDGLRVLAPKWVSERQINGILVEKAGWIIKKLNTLQKEEAPTQAFKEGEMLLFLGEEYYLKITEGAKAGVKTGVNTGLSCTREIEVTTVAGNASYAREQETKELIKELLYRWYKKEASEILAGRVELYAKQTGFKPAVVRIKDQKSRWGSCSSKGNLNLNWRLVMAPMDVIDYVIVHELVHLKHMNHSRSFWGEVEKWMPDYKARKAWLKANGARLRLE